jgi:hypothetical protein
MKPTRSPGFTAENSLYIGDIKYHSVRSATIGSSSEILPQLRGCGCNKFGDCCCWFGHSGFCVYSDGTLIWL